MREAAGHGNKKIFEAHGFARADQFCGALKAGEGRTGAGWFGDRHDRVQNVNDTFWLAGTGDLKIDVKARA